MLAPRASLLAALALTAASIAPAAAQTVVSGPIFNPATDSRYYLIDAPTFAAAQQWAQNVVRGHVVEINDAAENTFVLNSFVIPGDRKVEIGLNDAQTEGAYVWASGLATPAYRNWAPGEPGASNTSSADHVQMFNDGLWYPRQDSFSNFVVVETNAPVQVPAEFATINAAVAYVQSLEGGVVEIAEGTFPLSAIVNISKAVTLRGRGAARTQIVGPTNNTRAIEVSATFPVVVEDMTVTAALNSFGPIVDSFNAGSLTLRRVTVDALSRNRSVQVNGTVRIESSTLRGGDSAFEVVSLGDQLLVVNSLITGVESISVSPGSVAQNVDFVNSTISGVTLPGAWADDRPRLLNCVISDVPSDFFTAPQSVTRSLTPVPVAGAGNITGAPQFVNAGAGDFRLLPTSLGVDAGDADAANSFGAALRDATGGLRILDIAGVPNTGPDAFGLDMGAYETPTSLVPACRADFNNDTELTFDDIQAFVAAFNAGC